MQISMNKNYTLQLPSPIVQVHPLTFECKKKEKESHTRVYTIRELKKLNFSYFVIAYILKDLHLIDIINLFVQSSELYN